MSLFGRPIFLTAEIKERREREARRSQRSWERRDRRWERMKRRRQGEVPDDESGSDGDDISQDSDRSGDDQGLYYDSDDDGRHNKDSDSRVQDASTNDISQAKGSHGEARHDSDREVQDDGSGGIRQAKGSPGEGVHEREVQVSHDCHDNESRDDMSQAKGSPVEGVHDNDSDREVQVSDDGYESRDDMSQAKGNPGEGRRSAGGSRRNVVATKFNAKSRKAENGRDLPPIPRPPPRFPRPLPEGEAFFQSCAFRLDPKPGFRRG